MEKNKETSVEAANLRRRANAAFSNSKEHHKLLLDGIPGIVYSFSNKRGGLYYSSYVNKLLGYSPEQLYSQPLLWHNSIHPDDVLQVDQTICETTADKAFCIEYRIKDAQGDWHWFDDRSFGYRIDGEEVIIEGIALDITERKKAEAALRENEERFREVLEHSLDASYKRNLQTNSYDYLSPVFTQVSGYTADEFMNLPTETVMNIIHPDDQAMIEDVIAESMSCVDDTSYQVEYRFKHKDGDYRWFIDKFIDTRNAKGLPTARIGSVSDITERKQAEDELQKQRWSLENIVEGTRAGTWEWNVQTGEVVFNERWAQILGYTLNELSPISINTWEALVHPDDLKQSDELLEQHFTGKLNYYDY